MRPQLYTQTRVLAAPSQRATPGEAQLLNALARGCQQNAIVFGVEPMNHRDALARARENLQYVRNLAERNSP